MARDAATPNEKCDRARWIELYGCASEHVQRGYANAISAAFLTPFHMASP